MPCFALEVQSSAISSEPESSDTFRSISGSFLSRGVLPIPVCKCQVSCLILYWYPLSVSARLETLTGMSCLTLETVLHLVRDCLLSVGDRSITTLRKLNSSSVYVWLLCRAMEMSLSKEPTAWKWMEA
jgi:hypothetical protein